MSFKPHFTITNRISSALTKIERARGFLEAAKLSEDWILDMQERALVLEAHHTTHIEGTHLTLSQSERLFAGKKVSGADPQDVRELLNYRSGYDFKRLFTISGYYDRDRPAYYQAIQDVRVGKGRKAGLNERQVNLLSFLLKQGKGSMAEFEATLELSRRTLQRDLKMLAEKGFAREVGTSPTDPTKYYEPIL